MIRVGLACSHSPSAPRSKRAVVGAIDTDDADAAGIAQLTTTESP
jgi:hypothetical protein